VDITTGPMEVGPTCHYMMGGIRVDAETEQSTVAGLYAAGEAAAGLHGANRLGGNSLSDLLVFGKRAGKAAAEYAKGAPGGTIDSGQVEAAEREMLVPFEHTGEYPYEIHRELQETMQSQVGIFRVEADLRKALENLEQLKPRLERVKIDGSRMFNPGWHLTRDLRSMLLISEAVTRSALARQESRGAHSRIDYPKLDDEWGKKNNIISNQGGTMNLRQELVSEPPADLQKLLAETK
jgi:succinate dehydrogenase / fumarate reductase, flavoprotein subunit